MSRLPRLLPALLLACLALAAALPLAGQGDKKGKKYAVLVGVTEYTHAKLPDLKYTENDVEDLARLLTKKDAGFTRVELLTSTRGKGRAAASPTAANVRAALKRVLDKATKHDTILVALAGHGVQLKVEDPRDKKVERDEAFFCPADARLKNTRDRAELTKTLISLKELFDELDGSGAGVKLLLVDACRDDPATGRNVDVDNVPRPPRGTAALFSCASGQRAFETDKLGGKGHGLFFHFVLEGLRGKAKNEDGEVGWHDLTAYVCRQVPRTVVKVVRGGAQQSPHLVSNLINSPILVKPDPEDTKLEDVKSFTNKAGMKMVRIPAGKFTMGSPKDEKGRFDAEGPTHQVKITKPFYMAAHTVTRGQFRKFVDAEEYKTDAEKDGKGGYGYNAATKKTEGRKPKYTWRNPGWKQSDRHPVVNVSWNDAVAYCKWLSKVEGKTYRLPTEAQWEYACRAGTTTRYYFGDDEADLKKHANIVDQSLKEKLDVAFADGIAKKYPGRKWFAEWDDGYPFTAPVGSFQTNPWGLYDMHGNVWQWCRDCYDEKFYKDSAEEDPECTKGDHRVLRGGSWIGDAWNCRAALRLGNAPADRYGIVGFRVVFVPAARTP
jgi:formylglycine-generating enzyme required for sulfatase activity